jgi:hypothetical protein
MAKQRVAQSHAGILGSGGDQQRRTRLERAVHRPDGIAEPGRNVHVGDRGFAGRLRVEAGRRHGNPLVKRDVVGECRVVRQPVEQGILGGAGIAEDRRDAVRDECVQEYLTAARAGPPRRSEPMLAGPGTGDAHDRAHRRH